MQEKEVNHFVAHELAIFCFKKKILIIQVLFSGFLFMGTRITPRIEIGQFIINYGKKNQTANSSLVLHKSFDLE